MGQPTFDTRVQRSGIGIGIRRVIPLVIDTGFLVSDLWYQKKVWTSEFIGGFKQTQGTETSQYLEERTSTETPLVVASERGPGQ